MNSTTIKAHITATEAALTAVLASASPNYTVSGPNGSRSISKADYIRMLTDELLALNNLLNLAEPYWIEKRVVV